MVKVLKVYCYRSSGKLIAAGLGDGQVLPLNGDLTFRDKPAHRVGRSTQLELTPWRIEVEANSTGRQTTYRFVRFWNEVEMQRRTGAGIGDKLNISPSREMTDAEREYTGESSGHGFGILLWVSAPFLALMAGI